MAAEPAGTALSYVWAPLAANTTVVGSGAVKLWLRSSTPDVDLQATISEVRPDGNETFVQNGWMRASERKLDRRDNSTPSSAPRPEPTAADASPLPRGSCRRSTIPLYYQGHAYRTGSRIRLTVASPSGDQPIWSFARCSRQARDRLHRVLKAMPSRLLLPAVTGVSVGSPLPACPSLRSEPCRTYKAIANRRAG